MDILLKDIPELEKKYQFQFEKYDINILRNYQLLEKMEAKIKKNIGEDIPIIFVGDSVFYGPEAVRKNLASTLKILSRKKSIPEKTFKIHVDSIIHKTGEINLYYFYQLECPKCNRTEILLNGLKENYPALKIYRYEVFEDSGKILYEALAEARNVPFAKRLIVPAIFIGNDYLIENITSTVLESLIIKYEAGSPRLDTLKIEAGEKSILNRFSKFSIFGIIAAGFLDGINPCAFATIIFFVSYLLFTGRRRKDIVLMSIFFIAAVFLSYLAIGIGAYKLLRYLAGFVIIAKIIYLLFGIIAFVFGVLSIYDYFVARKGEPAKMILQLPQRIKQRIHKDIKEKTKFGGIIIGSFIAGFLISFLEFGCTGQVYLPTITFIISKAGFTLKPLLALLVYNIMFVIPLIIIALVSIMFTTKDIARSLAKKIPAVKIFTAVLFFGLGFLLILSI